MSAEVAAKALALIKANDCAGALALIEALPIAAQRDEAVARTYALALAQSDRVDDALAVLQRLLNHNAPAPATVALAARLLEDTSRFSEAFSRYAQLVATFPQQYGFWRGLWRCLTAFDAGDHEKDTALIASRRHAIDWVNDETLAVDVIRTLRKNIRPQDIETLISVASSAREKFPDHLELRWLAGKVLVDGLPLSQEPSALDSAGVALNKFIVAEACCMPTLFRDDHRIDAWRKTYGSALSAMNHAIESGNLPSPDLMGATAFGLAYHGRSNVDLQRLRGRALAAIVAPLTPITPRTTRQQISTASQRIRVGFVSKHVRDCTVGHYFRRFFTDLTDPQIEVEIFAVGDTDAFTNSIANHVSQLHRFPLKRGDDDLDETLRMIATAVYAREFDVLIYPEVGMEPLIEKLAAMRLAPMQCAFWGHPDTTGLPTIDVFFSAEGMEPAHAEAHYSERLILLPGLGCAYPRPAAPDPMTRDELALPNNVALFVCAQSSFKWRPRFLDCVTELLQRNAEAKLVYFRNRDALAAYAFDNYLGERLRAAGIDPQNRTIALHETTRARFLATLAVCDVALDTFDFSGGNTTLDSLSVGLPVVSLPGEFMRGRQSMAMLRIVGADELIAEDATDYVRIASALIGDASARAAIRDRLRDRTHPLFDDGAPVRALREWLIAHAKDHRYYA